MSKNSFFKFNSQPILTGLIFLFVLTLFACKNSDQQNVDTSDIKEKSELHEKLLIHNVFLDLKDSISKEDKAYALQELKRLKDIPEVMSLVVGTKANTGDPRLNKNYDIALHVSFKTMEELKIYDKDSTHSDVRKNLKNLLAGPPEVFDYWSN